MADPDTTTPPSSGTATSGVAITFIDILFAVVVGKLLEWSIVGGQSGHYYGVIAVADVATILSWLGYHSSPYRPRGHFAFFSPEAIQFVLDIAIVSLYFGIGVYARAIRDTANDPIPMGSTTALDAFLVFAIFALYLAWDAASFWAAKKAKKQYCWPAALFTALGLLLALVAWLISSSQGTSPVFDLPWVDVYLLVILLVYRVVQMFALKDT